MVGETIYFPLLHHTYSTMREMSLSDPIRWCVLPHFSDILTNAFMLSLFRSSMEERSAILLVNHGRPHVAWAWKYQAPYRDGLMCHIDSTLFWQRVWHYVGLGYERAVILILVIYKGENTKESHLFVFDLTESNYIVSKFWGFNAYVTCYLNYSIWIYRLTSYSFSRFCTALVY